MGNQAAKDKFSNKSGSARETDIIARSDSGVSGSSDRDDVSLGCLKKVNYDLDIPKSDMEWLDKNAI